MEKENQNLGFLVRQGFFDNIREGFKLFTKVYVKIIIPLALFQILLIILNVLLLTHFNWYIDSITPEDFDMFGRYTGEGEPSKSEMNAYTRSVFLSWISISLQNMINIFIITIAMCSVSLYTYKKYIGEDITVSESMKSLFNKKMLIAIFILGICIPIGGFLLYIPGIIIFGFYIFLVFTYNMEGVKKPAAEAKYIAKGAFWNIIGTFLISYLLIFLFNMIFTTILDVSLDTGSEAFQTELNSWKDPDTRNYGMLMLFQILYSLVEIILAPLWICLLTVLFASMKAKKDLGPQYESAYSPVKEYNEEPYFQSRQPIYTTEEDINIPPSQDISIKDRLYCPFCGFLITSPKKFCPKCGENLSELTS